MTPTAAEIRGIYAGIESRPGLGYNAQGWNSENPIFDEMIGKTTPSVIVEVGVFKGASIIHMAKCCAARGLPTIFYAVDAFVGRAADEIGHHPESQIPRRWDTPSLYEQFLFNISVAGFSDRVIPVPNFTTHGAKMLAHWGVVADALYIDADHGYHGASADVNAYWPLLRVGGIMIGDDMSYSGVARAVGEFCAAQNLNLAFAGSQWMLVKP